MHMEQSDYISLTDMAKARTDAVRAADVIKNWLRTRSTLEVLGTWEIMYNPAFKVVEFDHFKSEAGLHTFTLSAKEWIKRTNAVGIYVQAGRYWCATRQEDNEKNNFSSVSQYECGSFWLYSKSMA